jgi:hypothetical protein
MLDSEGMIRAQALSKRSLRPLFFVVMTGIKV